MRSRLPRDAAGMDYRVVAPGERMARAIGLPVLDSAGMMLGVVVGRIHSGTTIDLLVRRRRPFRRARHLRLDGTAISLSGRTLVYEPAGKGTVRLEVLRPRGTGADVKGDAA
jgi:hypothetical protein